MDTNYKGLWRVDIKANEAVRILKDSITKDLEIYIASIISSIPKNQNKKKFSFTSDTTEVRTAMNMIMDGDFDKAGQVCAERLLKAEIKAQKEVQKNFPKVEIQKGVLLVCYISDGESRRIIMTKNDHSGFINVSDYKKTTGLPTKKKVFKAFVNDINNETSQESLYVYDINSSMSKYWWEQFLELEEVHTSKHNTRAVFDELEKSIFKKIKNKFRADHLVLRNSTIKEFRTKEVFNLSEYQKIWEDYEPIDSNFPKNKYLQKIKDLANSNKFDTLFNIDKGEIKARMLNIIQLNPKLELVIKEELDVIKDYVDTYKAPDGKKYIIIKTDIGYETFKEKEKKK